MYCIHQKNYTSSEVISVLYHFYQQYQSEKNSNKASNFYMIYEIKVKF